MKTGAVIHKSSTTEDHIYYDLTVYNAPTSTEDILAQFTETRAQAILDHPEEYNLTVDRFSVPSSTIPLFEFEDDTYYVTLTHAASGDDYSEVVVNTPTSTDANGLIFSVYSFIDDINNAFAVAHTALNIAHPGVVSAPPFLIWNASTSLFSLVCGTDYATGYPNNAVQIWMNWRIYEKFSGFQTLFAGYNNVNLKDIKFIINDIGNNQYTYTFTGGAPAGPWLIFTQEAPANSLTEAIRIIFTSNMLPVQSDQVAVSSNALVGSTSTAGKSSSLNIITDFVLDLSGFVSPVSTQQFVFNPSIYRLIPLVGSIPLQTIDIKAYYATRDGRLYPLYINPGESLNIKLLFLRKGLTS